MEQLPLKSSCPYFKSHHCKKHGTVQQGSFYIRYYKDTNKWLTSCKLCQKEHNLAYKQRQHELNNTAPKRPPKITSTKAAKLTDNYIKSLLTQGEYKGVPRHLIPQKVVDMKRAMLMIKRQARENVYIRDEMAENKETLASNKIYWNLKLIKQDITKRRKWSTKINKNNNRNKVRFPDSMVIESITRRTNRHLSRKKSPWSLFDWEIPLSFINLKRALLSIKNRLQNWSK